MELVELASVLQRNLQHRCVAEKSATQMCCRKICNTDAPGTKPTNFYVNICNTDALSKNLQHGCVAEPETCTELARKLQELAEKFQYNLHTC
jgi:hypothetical protein